MPYASVLSKIKMQNQCFYNIWPNHNTLKETLFKIRGLRITTITIYLAGLPVGPLNISNTGLLLTDLLRNV